MDNDKKLSPEFLSFWKRLKINQKNELVQNTPNWRVEQIYEDKLKQYDTEEFGF